MAVSFSFTEAQRRRAVAMVVALTRGTPLEPQSYERRLLARFEAGELTLTEFTDLLEASVYQLLYHSRANSWVGDMELQELLAKSKAYNAAHGITGLLLYSEGYFVQVLEGPKVVVTELFARIRQDARHTQVVAVWQGPGPLRFGQWSMGFGYVAPSALQQAIHAMDQEWLWSVPEVDDQRLLALLNAFS